VIAFGVAMAGEVVVDETVRATVLEEVARRLESTYVFPETGQEVAHRLRAAREEGRYDKLSKGEAFAARVQKDLRAWTGDGHLGLEFSETPLGSEVADAAFEQQETERYYGQHLNFGFARAEWLEGNIGLLDLRVFAPLSMGERTAVAAMQLLAHTDALIIDLRDNGGGHGEMGDFLASYFVEGKRPLNGFYSRPEDETTEAYTLSSVPGPRYGETRPLYVLVSRKTFSAAESFAYALQALGRATVIGEPTGGGAHPFEYQTVHPHFVLWNVTGRSINPITGSNWQGVGVQPDVRVRARRALQEALNLLRRRPERR
jgi:hypothetical protein